jgi:serine O-acetyltransferase
VGPACVCEDGGLRSAIREDLDRYVWVAETQHGMAGFRIPFRAWLLSQGLWATTAYRLTHYARYRLRSRLLRVLSFILHITVIQFTEINIDAEAHIGPGLRIPHGGYIVIGPVRIGRNCEIFQGATLGQSVSTIDGRHPKPVVPSIGDRVWIGPGAVIAGDVTVGDDASVGANSLVVRDVPSRGVVLGVPARLISRRGSFAQIGYREMQNDDVRNAALADAEATPDGNDSPTAGIGHGPDAST